MQYIHRQSQFQIMHDKFTGVLSLYFIHLLLGDIQFNSSIGLSTCSSKDDHCNACSLVPRNTAKGRLVLVIFLRTVEGALFLLSECRYSSSISLVYYPFLLFSYHSFNSYHWARKIGTSKHIALRPTLLPQFDRACPRRCGVKRYDLLRHTSGSGDCSKWSDSLLVRACRMSLVDEGIWMVYTAKGGACGEFTSAFLGTIGRYIELGGEGF